MSKESELVKVAERIYPYMEIRPSAAIDSVRYNEHQDTARRAYILGYREALNSSIREQRGVQDAEIQNLVAALGLLLQIKDHKDAIGKDDWYEINQPIAWENARRAIYPYAACQ